MAETSNTLFGLDGKVALVTGAASGIGAGIAAVLAEAKATVIIADRDDAGARREAETLAKAGHKAATAHVDMADEASIVRCCADVVGKHGTPWVLVNNAGVQDREALLEATAEEWDRIHKINARGPFLMTREIGKAMAKAGQGGRIVNIASIALDGGLIVGLAPYTASKGALRAFSMASAFELIKHRITVNTVNPGGVMTPGSMNAKGPPPEGPAHRMPPLGMCEPRDIGAAVLFFATPAAHRVTNQCITVEAGFQFA